MRPLLGPETFIVPLENGVEAPDPTGGGLGGGSGFWAASAASSAPSRSRAASAHGGMEPYVAFGELDHRPSERARRLQAAFERAGVRAEIPTDIPVALWEKFLFIAPFAALERGGRAPVGVLRSVPQLRRMLEDAIAEAFAVGRARGVHLPDGAPAHHEP